MRFADGQAWLCFFGERLNVGRGLGGWQGKVCCIGQQKQQCAQLLCAVWQGDGVGVCGSHCLHTPLCYIRTCGPQTGGSGCVSAEGVHAHSCMLTRVRPTRVLVVKQCRWCRKLSHTLHHSVWFGERINVGRGWEAGRAKCAQV